MRVRMKPVSLVLVCLLTIHGVAIARAGEAQPELTVTTANGAVFDLAAQRGHWVIVNYWATWCEACLEEMPMLRRFAAAHPKVRLVGLTYQHITAKALRQFLVAHPAGYPVARVDQSALPRALKPVWGWFGIRVLPLTYAIAPDGTVAKRWVGELDAAKLLAVVGRRS